MGSSNTNSVLYMSNPLATVYHNSSRFAEFNRTDDGPVPALPSLFEFDGRSTPASFCTVPKASCTSTVATSPISVPLKRQHDRHERSED